MIFRLDSVFHLNYGIPMIPTSIRLPKRLKDRLASHAKREGIGSSEIVRRLIHEHLRDQESNKRPGETDEFQAQIEVE